jgi:hypothetical protein
MFILFIKVQGCHLAFCKARKLDSGFMRKCLALKNFGLFAGFIGKIWLQTLNPGFMGIYLALYKPMKP